MQRLPIRTSLILALVIAGCAAPPEQDNVFEPGDENDAVLRLAIVSSGTNTVQVTVTNPSSYALGEGLITFAPLYTVDTTPSSALQAYLSGPGTALGNVTTLASSAGLVFGTTAFKVPAIAAGGQVTILTSVPIGSQLSYLARETLTTADFVASYSPMNFPNGSSGTFQTGFSLNSANKVTRGNNSVGATPSIAVIAFDVTQNCGSSGNMSRPLTLLQDNFAGGANSSRWPINAGYDADFNGDWISDGITARVWNPPGGNPQMPLPATTGFVKFLDICPTDGATITLSADVNTAFTSANSDTTLVLYYFNASGGLIRVDANARLGKGNVRRTTLFESPVPSSARRIAIVPMALFAAGEANTVFFSSLTATYRPKNTFSVTSIASETLAIPSNADEGKMQPKGWTEFGGDYFVIPNSSLTTLWNSTWGGDQSKLPPIDTGIVKRYALTGWASGDVLDARVFAAATFTDASSFVRIRVLFNNSSGTLISALDSDRLAQRSYANVELLERAIPAGTTSIDVILNAYLGPSETSSFYAQDLSINRKRQTIW